MAMLPCSMSHSAKSRFTLPLAAESPWSLSTAPIVERFWKFAIESVLEMSAGRAEFFVNRSRYLSRVKPRQFGGFWFKMKLPNYDMNFFFFSSCLFLKLDVSLLQLTKVQWFLFSFRLFFLFRFLFSRGHATLHLAVSVRPSVRHIYCSCPTVRDWIAVYPALLR